MSETKTSVKSNLGYALVQTGALPPHSTDDFSDNEYIMIALTKLLERGIWK